MNTDQSPSWLIDKIAEDLKNISKKFVCDTPTVQEMEAVARELQQDITVCIGEDSKWVSVQIAVTADAYKKQTLSGHIVIADAPEAVRQRFIDAFGPLVKLTYP